MFFDPAAGELLRADLYQERLSGDSIVNWIGAVHYGAFASWIGKTVWTLSGIGVAISALSGAWVYFARRRR